jgi:beta-phosphoglucomutase
MKMNQVLNDRLVHDFEAIVSGFDLPGKPDPAVFLKAAHLIGVPPERCVVFEDAIAGVESAKRAGMKCAAVATTNLAHALKGADVVVERLDELSLDTFQRLLVGLTHGRCDSVRPIVYITYHKGG